ncbi:MAG: hypothetical protein PVH19_06155 [Planctomycetia bacterium]
MTDRLPVSGRHEAQLQVRLGIGDLLDIVAPLEDRDRDRRVGDRTELPLALDQEAFLGIQHGEIRLLYQEPFEQPSQARVERFEPTVGRLGLQGHQPDNLLDPFGVFFARLGDLPADQRDRLLLVEQELHVHQPDPIATVDYE